MEDSKILELYNVRSELAIAQTEAKYGSYARKIAFNVLKSIEDSEECVSDAYMHLWNSIPPQRPSNFKAFLGKVARNLALDRFAANNAQKRGGGQVMLCLDELSDCLPSFDMEEEGVAQIISEFLKKQDPKKAKMFVRRYWYLDSIRDVAINCGCSDGSVKTTLCRMREALKAELEKEGINI